MILEFFYFIGTEIYLLLHFTTFHSSAKIAV